MILHWEVCYNYETLFCTENFFTVFHGSELELLFGPVPNPIEDDFANTLTDFYVNFVSDLDPGGEFHFSRA